MPQAQLPLFPSGTTQINTNLAFEKKEGQITWTLDRSWTGHICPSHLQFPTPGLMH